MADHVAGVRRMEKSCPLVKHINLCHSGIKEEASFESKILHGARTNLARLVLEGEEIQNHRSQGKGILNSKSEFRGAKVIRLVANKEQF